MHRRNSNSFLPDEQDREGNLYRPSNDYIIDTNPDEQGSPVLYMYVNLLDEFPDWRKNSIIPHKVKLESQQTLTKYREVEAVKIDGKGHRYEVYHFVTIKNYVWEKAQV